MKKLLCLMGGAMLLIHTYGQNTRKLTIGDTLPNLLLSNILNSRQTSTWLYDIDKPIILDFFETHCGGCIQLLPHLNKIHTLKKDSLSVYIVADESPEIIKKFLKTNPRAKNISLPFITNDTVLNSSFHFRAIPHEIWVGKDHVIKAITGYQYVNEENIQKLINGDQLHLPVKNDYLKYDPQQSFDKYDQSSRLIFSSTLRGYIANLPICRYDTVLLGDGQHKKIYFTNSDLLTFLRDFMGFRYISSRFQLLVKDSSKLIRPVGTKIEDHWFLNNSYCYELTTPKDIPDSTIHNYILQDLRKSLGLNIRFVKKNMPCYIIVRSEKAKIDPKTKGGEMKSNFYPQPGSPIFIHNKPLSSLVTVMNIADFSKENPIVLDETGMKSNLDLELDVEDVKNITKIGAALQPYGFHLIKATRPIEMLVISDL